MLSRLRPAPARRLRTTRRDRSVRSLALLCAVGATVLLTGGAWLSTYRSVTLVVDGDVHEVETHATVVADLLERTGVDVGPDDHVDPTPDAAVVDGMWVEVVHAREISLLLGEEEQALTVAALTVDEVLAQLGRQTLEGPAGRRDLVRPSRLSRVEGGMVVELSDPAALTLVVDGGERDIITDEVTVGAVLDRAGVELGPHDRVRPAVEAPVEHDLVVTVQRVEVREEAREEDIAYGTQEQRTDGLLQGERREASAGRKGVRRIVEEVTVVDGVETERVEVADEVVRAAQPRVVEVGTAPPPEPRTAAATPRPAGERDPAGAGSGGGASTGGSDGASGAGQVQEGKASWYDNPYGGYTAAHRTAPRGTVVTVTSLDNGRSVQVRINDRGPFVEGRVIDLNRKAFAELAAPSQGVIRVRVEW